MNDKTKGKKNIGPRRISRKDAIKKMGITALTTSTLFLLETKKAPATSNKEFSPVAPGNARPIR